MKKIFFYLFCGLIVGLSGYFIGFAFAHFILGPWLDSREEKLTSTIENTDEILLETIYLDLKLDTTKYCNEPWWPTFREMEPDVYTPGFSIVDVDSLPNGGYNVYFTLDNMWGTYYWPGCK